MKPRPRSGISRIREAAPSGSAAKRGRSRPAPAKKSPGPAGAGVKVHVYGPVPSRRLGFSLGIDILPYKTCTLDCVYCQLGPTKRPTKRRKPYYRLETVLSQIKEKIESGCGIDHITFSGSGEPMLNSLIGRLIRRIKAAVSIPVAVLTNSTLLTSAKARRDILAADVVVPSLDSATEEGFLRVNRPPRGMTAKKVIQGLAAFRREYKGQVWLEIMLVRGINDSPSEIRALKKAVALIKPDRVQLNTVVRPPAEGFAQPLSGRELEKIRRQLGPGTEITAEFKKRRRGPEAGDVGQAVLGMVRRRPVCLRDIAASLGKTAASVRISLAPLLRSGKIAVRTHRGVIYYEIGR